VVVDSAGNVFVAEMGNHRIRKITPAGVVTTFAGSNQGNLDGTGTNALFDSPAALAIDGNDNLYVSDAYNYNIRKITPAAVVTTFAGSTTPGATNGQGTLATFNFPQGLTRDAQGNLFVADTGNHLIRLITPAGLVSTIAGTGAAGQSDGVGTLASFDSPWGLIVNAQGTIYVSDTNNFTIRKLVPN
jgi:sugar lactone lactonase YvrE